MSKAIRATEQPGEYPPIGLDGSCPLEIDDRLLDVFLPDDEQETLPERGDFWIEKYESD